MVESIKTGITWVKNALVSLGVPIGLITLVLTAYGGLNAIRIDIFGYPIANWFILIISMMISIAVLARLLMNIIKELKKSWNEIKKEV